MDTSPPPAGGNPAKPASGIVTGTQRHGDAVVVDCTGDIDALTAPQLIAAVAAAMEKRPRTVVVDLSRVAFLASAGLAALVELHRMAGEAIRFRIVAAGSATLRPLTMTGLTDELAVFPTSAQALAT
ncbi:MAG TPA: STAS domain-containing protein [Actinophytocola sp.]|jgi:anti-anti-sigma factor|nr:STAS domain-containing protein [Actinophytocola sp.]